MNDYVGCVKALGRQEREQAYGKDATLKEKLRKKQQEWRFWTKGLGGTRFSTKTIRLPKFIRTSEFIGLVYPYPPGELTVDDILVPYDSLKGVFGSIRELRGLLVQEGLSPTRECSSSVIKSIKEQADFFPSVALFISRIELVACRQEACLQLPSSTRDTSNTRLGAGVLRNSSKRIECSMVPDI